MHSWAEQPREPLLIAGDHEAWLSLIALANRAHLSGADYRGPRVDWGDLEEHCRGELICLTGAPMVGVLSPSKHATDPSNPIEAVALTRRLAELYPHLYIELAHHHHPREKLINRGLVALAQRLDLPLVATNVVRFARQQEALAPSVLEAIGRCLLDPRWIANTRQRCRAMLLEHGVSVGYRFLHWRNPPLGSWLAAHRRVRSARISRFGRFDYGRKHASAITRRQFLIVTAISSKYTVATACV